MKKKAAMKPKKETINTYHTRSYQGHPAREFNTFKRLVFTSDGVGVGVASGVVSGVVRALMT